MNIRVTKGAKVRFHGIGGWDAENDFAHSHLKVGEIYTVAHIHTNNWSTDVYLEGFQSPFNSVLFDNVFEGDTLPPPPQFRYYSLDLYEEPFKLKKSDRGFIYGTIYNDMGDAVSLVLDKEAALEMAQQYHWKVITR